MPKYLKTLRKIARIWAFIVLIFIFLFILGHILEPDGGLPTILEAVSFLFFPLGAIVGLIISFRREFLGGSIAFFSFILFHFYFWIISGSFFKFFLNPYIDIIIAPAIIFIFCGLTAKTIKAGQYKNKSRKHRRKF